MFSRTYGTDSSAVKITGLSHLSVEFSAASLRIIKCSRVFRLVNNLNNQVIHYYQPVYFVLKYEEVLFSSGRSQKTPHHCKSVEPLR